MHACIDKIVRSSIHSSRLKYGIGLLWGKKSEIPLSNHQFFIDSPRTTTIRQGRSLRKKKRNKDEATTTRKTHRVIRHRQETSKIPPQKTGTRIDLKVDQATTTTTSQASTEYVSNHWTAKLYSNQRIKRCHLKESRRGAKGTEEYYGGP